MLSRTISPTLPGYNTIGTLIGTSVLRPGVIIGSGNCLSSVRRQAIREPMMTPVNWFSETKFSEILPQLKFFHLRNGIWKCSLFAWWLSCLDSIGLTMAEGSTRSTCDCRILAPIGFHEKKIQSLSKHGHGNDKQCGKDKAWMETRTPC